MVFIIITWIAVKPIPIGYGRRKRHAKLKSNEKNLRHIMQAVKKSMPLRFRLPLQDLARRVVEKFTRYTMLSPAPIGLALTALSELR